MSESGGTDQESDSASTGLVMACIVGSVTLGISLIVFEVLRRWIPTVYELRRILVEREDKASRGYYDEPLGTAEGPGRTPVVGWIASTLKMTPAKLEKSHGLDTAFFNRYLRSKVELHFLLTVLSCGVLLPIYYTAANKNLPKGNEFRTLGFEVFSLGNVPSANTWRFWASFLVFVLSVALTLSSVMRDYFAFDEARRRYRLSKNPSNYACLVQDIPREFSSEESIKTYWQGLFRSEIEYVHQACDASKLVDKKAKWLNAVTKRERAEWDLLNNPKLAGERPKHKIGSCAFCKGDSALVDSIHFWTQEQQRYEKIICEQQLKRDVKYARQLQSGIIVFKTKRAASVAAQTLFARKNSEWRTCRAPEPKAINWNALAMSGKSADIRLLATSLSITALSLFWVVPVVFIQGLANLESLSNIVIPGSGAKPFDFLRGVKSWNPTAIGLVEGLLPPIIQSVFLALIPVFIRLLVGISRVVSVGRQDTLVRNWFFVFLFFNGFLFVLLGGSALQSVDELLKMAENGDYKGFANLLAKSVPSQGTFFMTFCILKALSETPQLLMQLPRVVLRMIFRKLLQRTPRQLETGDMGGAIFLYFRYYAFAQLISLIGHVYSAVSPLMAPCVLLYYIMSYLVHTHNLSYNMVPPFGNGGMMFPGALKSTLISLIFQGLVMAGIYGLNGQALLSSVTFAFTGISTISGYLYIRRRFQRVIDHGSLVETQIADDEEAGRKWIQPKIARKYIHPGLEPLPLPVENRSGVEARTIAKNANLTGKNGSPKTPSTTASKRGDDPVVEIEAVESGIAVEMGRETQEPVGNPRPSPNLISLESGTSEYADARGE